MMRRILPLVLASSVTLAACGGSGKSNSSWSADKGTSAPATAVATPTAAPPAADGSKGVGPVDHVDIATLDNDALAASGKQLFTTKCSACHKLDERYIGPALAGVTTRRRPEWILNMMLNPEKMIVEDPTAKALLAEYLAPMANQSLARSEAESILAYFLEYDEEASEDSHDDDDDDASASTASSH